jgi:hypothetical protein
MCEEFSKYFLQISVHVSLQKQYWYAKKKNHGSVTKSDKKLSPLLFFFIFLCFLNLIMLFLFWDFNNFFLSRSRMRISFRFRYWTMVFLFCVSILFLKGYMHWDLKEIFWKFFTHIIYIIKITKFFKNKY